MCSVALGLPQTCATSHIYMYHVNYIKKGSLHTPQDIVNTFDDYKKALKYTLLSKSAIESPDHKFVDITLKDGSKGLMYSPCTLMDYASTWQSIV